MKYIIIIALITMLLLVGCTQPHIEVDKNAIMSENNLPLAACDDNTKKLTITDTLEEQIWECV